MIREGLFQREIHMDPMTQFHDAISSHGWDPGFIIADSKFHRFDIDRRRDRAGWYVFFGEAGAYGSWKGDKFKWSAENGDKWNDAQKAEFKRRMTQIEKGRADASGANGKSVLMDTLASLVGYEHVAAVQPSQFENRFQRAHLHCKLVNLVTEIAEGHEIADAQLKAIVSGELSTAEHKHKPPSEYYNKDNIDLEENLQSMFYDCGEEVESVDYSCICPYCAHQMSKDD